MEEILNFDSKLTKLAKQVRHKTSLYLREVYEDENTIFVNFICDGEKFTIAVGESITVTGIVGTTGLNYYSPGSKNVDLVLNTILAYIFTAVLSSFLS